MTSVPGTPHHRRRRWALPATIAALAIAIELGGAGARAALRYERGAVLDGELWRLLTGNLAHLGPRHLLLNLVGLGLIVALGGRALDGLRGAAIAAGAAAGVGLGLLAFAPAVGWYVGLSGVLHGMLAALALDAARDATTRRWGVALGVALAAKLAWEQVAGPVPFTAEAAGGPVIVVAHLHGALGGVLAACGVLLWERTAARRGAQV